MYNVRNTTGKLLAITLEAGSIVLGPGKVLDLDKHCSRKFIKNSCEIQYYLAGKALIVTHDSEVGVGKTTIKSPFPKTPAERKPKKVEKPVAVDLSEVADPTWDDAVPDFESVSFIPEVEEKEEVEKEEVEKEEVEKEEVEKEEVEKEEVEETSRKKRKYTRRKKNKKKKEKEEGDVALEGTTDEEKE